MERTDLLKDQIERVGKVLAKLIGDFIDGKSNVDAAIRIDASNEQFRSELDLDIDFLLKQDPEELKHFFEQRNYTEKHLEELSRYFMEVGKLKLQSQPNEGKLWIERALVLITIDLDTGDSFAFGELSSNQILVETGNIELRKDIESLLKSHI